MEQMERERKNKELELIKIYFGQLEFIVYFDYWIVAKKEKDFQIFEEEEYEKTNIISFIIDGCDKIKGYPRG